MAPSLPARLLLALSGLALTATSADACSVVVTREPSPAEKRRDARHALERATAVVDGEVVRPFAEDRPALVRAYRILKGPRQDYFEVGERHSCDRRLDAVGERLRMILVGGPLLYFLPGDYSHARHEDRLLRSDRRKAWPHRPGLPPPDAYDPRPRP